nr:ActS/PrrB/RegB family redox-sensitive histidine kinase [Paracoccus sp. (in: a-proteobacteria)]
ITGPQALGQLSFDTVQVGILLALAGGLDNPFVLFVLAPLTMGASALRGRQTLALAGLTAAVIVLMALLHVPLRFAPDPPLPPAVTLRLGQLLALMIGGAFFAAYAYRIAWELSATADALAATQMALAREQRLQHLGGVVAAAAHEMGTPLATIKLIASELAEELADDLSSRPELADDLRQLRASADRCRDIMRSMGQAGKDDLHLRSAPLEEVLREAAGPHGDRGIAIAIDAGSLATLNVRREAGLIHGLRNLIQNAVDFARTQVRVTARERGDRIEIVIRDDGPGYPPHLLARLGEPFLTTRRGGQGSGGSYEGMGLGLFIARTLLERLQGTVDFTNDDGAVATVRWPRAVLVMSDRVALGDNPAISG